MPKQIDLPYCPSCGSSSFHAGSIKPWHCKQCGFKIYPNIAAAAGVFIFNDEGKVLFNERAKEPSIGKLGIPGGFLDKEESAEEGVVREVKEEVGLHIVDLHYLSSFPNEYFYQGIFYDTLDMFFTARANSTEMILDPIEVSAVHWRSPESVSTEELAFPSYARALESLIETLKR